MESKWWHKSVVYQIYPRSFMDSNGDGEGDLQGIIQKLDYLNYLGVDILWLCPVYESPMADNGYDISNYYDIAKQFGTLQDMEVLIFEAHKRNIKIIMDLVVNHTSDEHPWFIESKKSKNNKYRDFYIWRDGKLDGSEPNNWASYFGGSAWSYDETTNQYYLHLYSKKQPDLNWENPKLRKEIYKMINWWLEKGIDGFRMDVINKLSKPQDFPDVPNVPKGEYALGRMYYLDGPKIHEYLQEMHLKTFSKFQTMTVGETSGVTTENAILYTNPNRKELDMVFQFDHMAVDAGPYPAGKWEVRPFDFKAFKQIMTKWQVELEGKGWNSLYWSNHDQPRAVSRFGNDTNYRIESAKMLATCLHFMKGTPYIYQGEEIGMTNVAFESIDDYRDIELINMYKDKISKGYKKEELLSIIHKKGRDNARTPMQWDDSENAGFTKGTPWINVNPNYKQINVKNCLQYKDSIFYYYKKLIELRKQKDIIVYGTFKMILEDHPCVYAYLRILGDEKLIVLCNFFNKESVVHLPKTLTEENWDILIHNYKCPNNNQNISKILLRPYETIVYHNIKTKNNYD